MTSLESAIVDWNGPNLVLMTLDYFFLETLQGSPYHVVLYTPQLTRALSPSLSLPSPGFSPSARPPAGERRRSRCSDIRRPSLQSAALHPSTTTSPPIGSPPARSRLGDSRIFCLLIPYPFHFCFSSPPFFGLRSLKRNPKGKIAILLDARPISYLSFGL